MRLIPLVTCLSIALSLFATRPALAKVIGSATAGSGGIGTITVPVKDVANLKQFVSDLADQVKLDCGEGNCPAKIESVEVEDGVAKITFSNAPGGEKVSAVIPDDSPLLAYIGAGPVIAREGGGNLLIGGLALGVTGGVLGGLAAAGVFDGSSRGVGPPPGVPPGPPPGVPPGPPVRPPASPF